jgi:hypothetical protein
MALLPPSTNAQYRGAIVSAWFLMLAGALEFVPGCIHYFLPDGGAGVIAGLDLSGDAETIVRVFAWMGALQIPLGALLFLVGLRYRTLVPLGLLVVAAARGLMSVDAWLLKGAGSGHHPPEHFGSPVATVLALVFLAMSLREQRAVQH